MKNVIRNIALTMIALMNISWSTDMLSEKYSGHAYEVGTAQHIYTEEYVDRYVNGRHIETITHYYDPDNILIVERELDFSASKLAPDFHTKDHRTGFEEGAKKLGNNKVLLYYKEDVEATLTEKIIEVPDPVVIDGGFNQFIKQNWPEIASGQEVLFHFTVSSRLDYFTLRAVKTNLNTEQMTISVEPDNTVLRWLVDPIVVNYDVRTKRMNSYRGKSNITNADGKNYIAKLVYPTKGP